jgi:hypothetical protein
MTGPTPSPLSATQLVDEYFIENRNRVLEIAAFLDRIDRADAATGGRDFRMQAFNEAVAALTGAAPNRLMHIQMLFSDPTTEPLPALDRKGAVGAFDRSKREARAATSDKKGTRS